MIVCDVVRNVGIGGIIKNVQTCMRVVLRRLFKTLVTMTVGRAVLVGVGWRVKVHWGIGDLRKRSLAMKLFPIGNLLLLKKHDAQQQTLTSKSGERRRRAMTTSKNGISR